MIKKLVLTTHNDCAKKSGFVRKKNQKNNKERERERKLESLAKSPSSPVPSSLSAKKHRKRACSRAPAGFILPKDD